MKPLCGSILLKKLQGINSSGNSTVKQLLGPHFLSGVPPPINTHNHCVAPRNHGVGQQRSEPHVYQGSPPLHQYTQPLCGHRNHCVGQYTSKNYWKKTIRAPCLSGVPSPHQHTQPLCRDTKPLCGFTHLKTVLEN